MQIIQHSGPLPASEEAEDKAALGPRIRRQTSDLGALRPKRDTSNRPQRVELGSVEGVLTLQLSHQNVVQTFKATTMPLQVKAAALTP